jgi:hypothetical protein
MDRVLRERGEPGSIEPGSLLSVGLGGMPAAGERVLTGVILYTDANGELRVIAGMNFQASWVHSLQRRLPFDDVQ